MQTIFKSSFWILSRVAHKTSPERRRIAFSAPSFLLDIDRMCWCQGVGRFDAKLHTPKNVDFGVNWSAEVCSSFTVPVFAGR
jgi:hypothetical protein